MKKVLIVGGTARSAKYIIDVLENEKYIIDLITYRQKNKIYGQYNWQHLDLEDDTSVNNFIKKMPINYYDKIIFLSGNAISNNINNILYEDLKKYYQSYSFNYNLLITNSIKSINNTGQIILITSIAANHAIKDAHYSAVKASNQALAKSLSLHVKDGQSVFSIAPGTITEEIRKNIAKIIIEEDLTNNGKVFELNY